MQRNWQLRILNVDGTVHTMSAKVCPSAHAASQICSESCQAEFKASTSNAAPTAVASGHIPTQESHEVLLLLFCVLLPLLLQDLFPLPLSLPQSH